VRPGIAFIALLASGLLQAALPPVVQASTTERVIVNRFSGLAIEGFDPVAYFTDGEAVLGYEQFEASGAGAVWRFRNEGNRDSFIAHPDVYGPQYGGYDPVGIARGIAVAGNPNVWLIIGERLFLFYSDDRREKFAANPNRVIGPADRQWPTVLRTLTP